MKGNLRIILNEEDNRIDFSPWINDDEYLITIYVSDMTKLENIINDEGLFNDMIEMYEYFFGSDEKHKDYIDFLHTSSYEVKDFLKTFDEVNILGEFSLVRKYIIENNLTSKRVFYNNTLPLKKESVLEVTKFFEDLPCVKFFVDGNEASVTLEEYTKTVEIIENIAHSVRSLGLSPMEEIMYVYDLVRDREYVAESVDEEYTVSRDLTSVLLGDKIVCVGFSVLFNEILNCLGYNTKNFVLMPSKGKRGHMRSLVYVEDEKYDISGMYFFDPTFDCRKNNSSTFLEKYLYFAKSYRQITKLDNGKFDNAYYSFFDDNVIDYIDELFDEEEINLFDLFTKMNLTYLNEMLNFSNQDTISIDGGSVLKESLIEKAYIILQLINEEIRSDKFLRILYNVRKQQYYLNPEKYAFDINTITNIILNSKLASKSRSIQENFLSAIFGVEFLVDEFEAKEIVNEFFSENDLEKDMERVKLTRVLKTILCKKENVDRDLSLKK